MNRGISVYPCRFGRQFLLTYRVAFPIFIAPRPYAMIAGNPAPASLDSGRWLTKEVRIEGTVHMGEAMIPAMRLIENGQVNLKPMVTEVIPLEEAQRAFDSLHNGSNIAVVLKP